ncbi:MAG TPA: DUF4240 domain-containing protein [Aequorivita sp.]|nr:DUF4240 domain-containing protein [Aequorivita sp.]
MISEKQFWDLIDRSINEKNSIDKNEQGDCLMNILAKQPIDKIAGFHNRMVLLREALRSPMMGDIAFMMKYGDNEHAYEGFRNWVISLGEGHYGKAKDSPAHLLTLVDPKLFVVGRAYFQDLNFVAQAAFFEKTGKDFGDWYLALEKEGQPNKERILEIKKRRDNEQDLNR